MSRYNFLPTSYQASSSEVYSRSARLEDASKRPLEREHYGVYTTVTQTRQQRQPHRPPKHRSSTSSDSSSSRSDSGAASAAWSNGGQYALELLAYRSIFVLQGAFMGMLGPALVFFSEQVTKESGVVTPVYGFGPIFAAHGGAALVMSFMSDFVLSYCTEKKWMKQLIVVLLLCSGTWYACLTPVAVATGNVGVGLYFIAKGFWTALLNITYVMMCWLLVAGLLVYNNCGN